MLDRQYEHLLYPTILDLLEREDFERAIEVSKSAVTAALESTQQGPFRKAEDCSRAYFQEMLLYLTIGRPGDAAEAAKKAFEYDHFLFDQYVPIISALLGGERPEYDKTAADAFIFFRRSFEKFHGDGDGIETIYNILEDVKDRSEDIKWAVADRDYITIWDELSEENRDEVIPKLLEIVDAWEEEGRDRNTCDALRANLYYLWDKEPLAVEVWGDRPLSDVPTIYSLVPIALSMIWCGIELPNPIPFPDDRDVVAWSAVTVSVYGSLRRLVANEGLTPKVLEILEETPGDKEKFFARVDFARKLAVKGLELYDRFFEGEVNGTATAPYQYIDFLDTQGDLLGKTGDREAGMEVLEKGMSMFPHRLLASSIADLALDMKDGEKALKAIEWQIEELTSDEEEEPVWERLHQLNRLKLWAKGLLAETYDDYLVHQAAYKEEYKDLYAYCDSMQASMNSTAPAFLREKVDEYFYASNNIREVLYYFQEKEPDNLEILSQLFLRQSYIPSDSTDTWISENIDKLERLRNDSDSEEGRRRLCDALTGAGFLLSVSTEAYDEEKDDDPYISDEEKWEKGYALIKEAEEYAVTLAQKLYICICKINLLRVVNRYDEVVALVNEGLELLKGRKPDCLPDECYQMRWKAFSLDLSQIPCLLYTWFNEQGYQKEALLSEDPTVVGRPYIERLYQLEPYTLNYVHYYLLSLFPKAFEDQSSEEFSSFMENAAFALDVTWRREEEFPESPKIYGLVARLCIKLKKFRFADRLLKALEENNYDDEEISQIKKELREGYNSFEREKAFSIFSKKRPEFKEAKKRRERSLHILSQRGFDIPSLRLVEPKEYVHQRSVQEIAERAVCAALIANMAEMALFNFDDEYIDEAVQALKEVGLEPKLDKFERGFIDKSSPPVRLWELRHLRQAAAALFWVLGEDSSDLVDVLAIGGEEIGGEHMVNLVEDYIASGKVVPQKRLRDNDEILDKLDFLYCFSAYLESDEFPVESAVDAYRVNLVYAWLNALEWVVDGNGFNRWSFPATIDYPYNFEAIYEEMNSTDDTSDEDE